MRNVIVTGIPRAGTTLAASLIDAMPDAVCLNEPGWHHGKSAATAEGFAQYIKGDFAQLRARLLAGEAVPDRRAAGGGALTNYYRVEGGRMKQDFETAPFTRAGLTPDFTLAIKHNGPYLAVLPQLIALAHFTIIAIVRHPAEVIHSWRSLSLPISEGRLPNAEPYWPELAALSASACDLLEKQARLYDLMCARIYGQRDNIHLLPYETLVKNPSLPGEYAGSKGAVDASRITTSKPVPAEARADIISAVRAHGTHWRHFYPEL